MNFMAILALLKNIPTALKILISIVQGLLTLAQLIWPLIQMMFSRPKEQKTIVIDAPGKQVVVDRPPLTVLEAPTVDVVHKPPTPEELQALKEKEIHAQEDIEKLRKLRETGTLSPPPADGPDSPNDTWVQADPQKGIPEGHWKSQESHLR